MSDDKNPNDLEVEEKAKIEQEKLEENLKAEKTEEKKTIEEKQKTKETYLKLIKYYLSAYSPKAFFGHRKAQIEQKKKA